MPSIARTTLFSNSKLFFYHRTQNLESIGSIFWIIAEIKLWNFVESFDIYNKNRIEL